MAEVKSIRVSVSKTVQERQYEPVTVVMEATLKVTDKEYNQDSETLFQSLRKDLEKQIDIALMDRLGLDKNDWLRRG